MTVQFIDVHDFKNIKRNCENSVYKSLYSDGFCYLLIGSGPNISDFKIEQLWANG